MKILAIRIKNLASLEGTTEIDFTSEPLCSAGIFAITGATGAGKSTILDAICLALYGKTPRYLQAKESGVEIQDVQGSTMSQGDVRSILRDGTADGFAEVDFVGIDNAQYRVNWSVRRARNRIDGSMQSDSVQLKNITSNVDIPGKKAETYKEIERLVGLNFEQFTRSVLLAQGDFTAFMKASKDEKSSLLEKLTGTHIYSEISKKIYEKFRVEEGFLRDLNLRKEGISTLSEEQIALLKLEQTSVESELKILESELAVLNNEIIWHNQLLQLRESTETASLLFKVTTEKQLHSAERKRKLELIEQIQVTRSWNDALHLSKKQQTDRMDAVKTVEQKILRHQKEKDLLEKKVAELELDFNSKSKILSEALPLLEQAKKLDIFLSEKEKQVKFAENELAISENRKSDHQVTLNKTKSEIEYLSDKIKTIENWQNENKERQPIADNKQIILSKLIDAQRVFDIKKTSAAELENLLKSIESVEADKTRLVKKLSAKTSEWESLKKKYKVDKEFLLLLPIEKIQLDKDVADREYEITFEAKGEWQTLFNLLNECESIEKTYQSDKSLLVAKQNTLVEISKKLAYESIVKETSAELLEHAKLATTTSVEDLRARLVDGKPCIVCGSENHPYSSHNPQLEKVLSMLEETHLQNEKTYLETFRNHSSLVQECQSLEKSIMLQSEEIGRKTESLISKTYKWQKFENHEIKNIPNHKRSEWFDEKLRLIADKKLKLISQIQSYAEERKKLDDDKEILESAKESLDALSTELKSCDNSLEIFKEKQINTEKEQAKAAVELFEVTEYLTPFFANVNWMEKWQADTTGFTNQIEAFTRKWTEMNNQLQDYSQKRNILDASLKQFETQTGNIFDEAELKSKTYLLQSSAYKTLQDQRNSIFNGTSAEVVDSGLKEQVETSQILLTQATKQYSQLTIDYAKMQAEREQLLAEILRLKADGISTLKKIQVWVDEYNIKQNRNVTFEILNELLSIPTDWIESERNVLREIDEEVTKATSALAERNTILNEHHQKRMSSREFLELTNLNLIAKNAFEFQRQRKSEIIIQLQQDEFNKSKIGDLLKTIDKQTIVAENWSKLNEIIGSADGKKFRQIAQEYTLDALLSHANIHLQLLTQRYRIERIPATLGLQIVDQDMGDEVRTVYSLSGGESFLVSLALALGLASLSTSRMKVESLFIDEGFGSLDPNTLNIAMDALERLHNQGRKVGVISHVQEMTERIPVQIKVSKMASGKSIVEVFG